MNKPGKYKKNAGLSKKRRCHDCGKKTDDYRCAACWAKLRGNSEYYMTPRSYHGMESMEAAYE